MLAHLDQNYAFIMRRLDIVLYTISSLLHNRAVATDVPSLCSRNSNRISPVFKLGKKNHIFRREAKARKRLSYAGFAILHSCQLQCPIDVKNGNGSSNAFPGWKLQFFLFSTRHLCCKEGYWYWWGARAAKCSHQSEGSKESPLQSQVRKKVWVFTIVFSPNLI